MRESLGPIGEHCGPPDLRYIQRKLSAAGNLRKAATKVLQSAEIGSSYTTPVRTKYLNQLKRAIEDFLNCP